MQLEVLAEEFTVCKVAQPEDVPFDAPWLFTGRTDGECSVVCRVEDAPRETLAREDGWRAFRVAGSMDFGMVGVLAGLATALSGAQVSIFAVSTFDTDYILVRAGQLETALAALRAAGHGVRHLRRPA